MSVRKGSKIIAGSYKVVKTDVYTREESDKLLDLKQDKLTAGKNITIDENNIISTTGGGAITNVVQETGDSVENVMSQYAVTSELNKKVNSADLPVVAITGDYIDLNNKPNLSVYPKIEDLSDVSFTGNYNDLSNTPNLGAVATTNNYNDLDNKPIIPTKTSQLDNDRDFITHHALLPYETIGSNDYKLSLKQNKLTAGKGITIEDDTISSDGSGGGGLELGDIGIAPLGIDENQNKRRYLNGQLISQLQFIAFTAKLKSAVNLYPTLACTESEWQTTATMTVSGQVGKFVIDDIDKTIRLPRIIMPIQGLTDLRNLAEIVEAGLPQHNHSGTTSSNGAHTHTRGTMEIAGTLNTYENQFQGYSGAFTTSGSSGSASYHTAGGGGTVSTISFTASRNWTGSTSSNGDHTHTMTTGDASNDLYGKSTTVQPEAIRYPYFIQVATGVEEAVNTDRKLELNTPFSLLEPKWSDKILNNPSWLRSYGQPNNKFLYPDAYNYLLQEYNNGIEEAEIIDGITIVYKRGAETNIKVTTDKIAYDAILASTGTAWYFVIDLTSETFYLPQTNGFFQFGGTGEFVKAGLPTLTTNQTGNHTHTRGTMNITGTWSPAGLDVGYLATPTGAFANSTRGSNGYLAHGAKTGNTPYINFNASNGWTGETSENGTHTHTIEGTSDTVQPNAVKGYLYFYVGEFVQDANLINAGRVLEILPEKLGSKLDSGDFYNKLTNCLLEIPQKVKLELNNGVLTLKAGSQVIVPNGFEEDGVTPKFDYVDIESDLILTRTWGTAEPVCIFFNLDDGGIAMGGTARFSSGTTAPTLTNAQWWYDTTTNLIKRYSNASDSGSRISFPIAICTKAESVENSVIVSIDQVFNCMGYIGSTVWVDKGVKGLIPNGRNEDGTLKNIEYTNGRLLVRTFNVNSSNVDLIFDLVGTDYNSHLRIFTNDTWLDSITNTWVTTGNGILNTGLYLSLGNVIFTNGKIGSFNPKETVNLLLASSTADLIKGSLTECVAITETYQNGTSWYRVYSDGWCEQGGICNSQQYDTVKQQVTFLKPYIDTNYMAITSAGPTTNGTWQIATRIAIKTTTGLDIRGGSNANASYTGQCSWYTAGYIR